MKTNRIIIILILITSFSIPLIGNRAAGDTPLSTYVQSIEKKIGARIIYDRMETDTWKGSTYTIPGNKKLLKHYLKLILREYSKYPYGYLKKARADNLVLCENYKFKKNHQAAMPDPYSRKLFLAIDGAYGNHTDTYLVHVLHHELHHCTEYAIWQNQYYKWSEWSGLNTPGFTYGRGGRTAYQDSNTDYYKMNNPRPGFINLYSTTGQEEDRSEIFSLMMSDIERPILHRYCKKDPILQKKVKKMVSLINKFMVVPDNSSHWEIKNSACYE